MRPLDQAIFETSDSFHTFAGASSGRMGRNGDGILVHPALWLVLAERLSTDIFRCLRFVDLILPWREGDTSKNNDWRERFGCVDGAVWQCAARPAACQLCQGYWYVCLVGLVPKRIKISDAQHTMKASELRR